MHEGLARLGVRRLLVAIHDVSFPSDPDEDLGRGSPATRASARLFPYLRALGFTGIQLGPQGQTSRANPSPYDGTIFSRHLGNVSAASWRASGLVTADEVEAAIVRGGGPAQHAHNYDATHALLAAAHARLPQHPDVAARLARFRADHASWVERDAMHAAVCEALGGAGFRSWPAQLPAVDPGALERYALGQMLVHEDHARVRAACAQHGLLLYGDLQVGYADADAWAFAGTFLRGYRMGAPPSRTNPEGQPWGYPVLDPDQYAGAAKALVVARADKAFADYDSLRIDHPHGLVCPWVYRDDDPDPDRAVRDGARLFESPDVPGLARHAIARADQLDRSARPYADEWVTALEPAQVDRYATLVDALVDSARRHGRDPADLSFEVLSTMPRPLEEVLRRYRFGRWRVTQKANLDDPRDVYRTENIAREDWAMLGNHDTAPILAAIRGWTPAKREAWARHLAGRLALPDASPLARDGFLATAMLADIFASRAENVSIFFADLFGETTRFNVPGLVDAANWTLRLPPDFEELHAGRLAAGQALDLPLAVELALSAREGLRAGA